MGTKRNPDEPFDFGDLAAGPVVAPALLISVGAFFTGSPGIGLVAAVAALVSLTSRRFEIDPLSGSLTRSRSLLGLPLWRTRWALGEIDRVLIEPASRGFVTWGYRGGYAVSAVRNRRRIFLVESHDETEAREAARAVAEALPHRVRVERREFRVSGRVS